MRIRMYLDGRKAMLCIGKSMNIGANKHGFESLFCNMQLVLWKNYLSFLFLDICLLHEITLTTSVV